MFKHFTWVLINLSLISSEYRIYQTLTEDYRMLNSLRAAVDALSNDFSCLTIFTSSEALISEENPNKFLVNLQYVPTQLVSLSTSKRTQSTRNALNIFWLQHEDELGGIFNHYHADSLRHGKMSLVFVNRVVEMTELADVFKTLSSLALYNVNVLTVSGGDVVMASFMPFQNAKCRDASPAIVNTYNETLHKWINEAIFPEKLRNFHKCPLGVSTLLYPPAVMKSLSDGTARYYGSDVEVLNGLASAMNFTANLSHVAEPYNFGVIDDRNSTGAISHVATGDADIAMGFYFLIHDKLKYLSHSYP